jgi:hypothetical protein
VNIDEDLRTLRIEVASPDKGSGRVDRHLPGDERKLGCLDSRDLHVWRARLAKFGGIEES